MYKADGMLVYSPSDLTTFMVSPFASWMSRWSVECPQDAPDPDEEDTLNAMLADKGLEHEAGLLAHFQAQGLSIVDIAQCARGANQDIKAKLTATYAAMHSGADVIYQGVLQHEQFRGHADFLVKVAGASVLGDYYYEVWDTKLASSVKPSFLVQLCCYAEMLEPLQGVRPAHIVVALGNDEQVRLKTDDYFYYYQALIQLAGLMSRVCATGAPSPSSGKLCLP